MAGRMRRDNHRGHPPKLGRPTCGTMRRLTVGETIATGLPRSALVMRMHELTYIYKPSRESACAGGWASNYVLVEEAGPYAALAEYWKDCS